MLHTIVISHLVLSYAVATAFLLAGLLAMFTTHRLKELTWKVVARSIGAFITAPLTVPAVILFILTVSMIDFRQSGN